MKDGNVDVSFIVPARNEEKNMARCIESLLACSSEGLVTEVCVIDNGSTDSTVELACALGAVVHELPGVSISSLRNYGASVSKGQWIAFIDADVTIESDWLDNAAREIRKPGVAVVGASPMIPVGSNWVVRTWHMQISLRPDYCQREWLASMNMLVKRDVFEQVGGFDETLMTCEDVDLGYRITRTHKIVQDKRIRAIHHGEAQSLWQLFKKEAWRGSYNYRGLLRHGWQAGELPSLVQPVLTFIGLVGVLYGVFTAKAEVSLPALVMFTAFPVAKTVQMLMGKNTLTVVPALLLVWTIYSLARVWSSILEVRHLLLRAIRPVSTRA